MSLDSVLDIGLFILILIVLVIVHELGHMLVAKWSGMKVERFSVFMGRPLVSFTKGETEYGFGWLPLGGYVKITGMTPDEEIDPADEPRAYYRASTGRRIATIFAGPAVNLVIAFLTFVAIAAFIGFPTFTTTNTVGSVIETVDDRPTPAAQFDLAPGDQLVAVNGVSADGGPEGIEAIRSEIESNIGTPIEVVYRREGEILTAMPTPEVLQPGSGRGQLGFSFLREQDPSDPAGITQGIAEGSEFTWFLTEQYGALFKELVVSEEARESVNSVVGAGAVFDVVADNGLLDILFFFGAISFALGIFNLIPILPLDGGHIVIALVERFKRSPLSSRAYQGIALAGIFVIIIVFLYVLQNDIALIRGGDLAERLGNP